MSIVIEHIETIRKLGLNDNQMRYYDFLLENGKLFQFQVLEKNIPPFIKKKQCFKNSLLMTMLGDDNFEYYEGYYVCRDIPIPIEHAFNIKGNAFEVSDLTVQKFDIPVIEWFGVQIPKRILEEWLNGDQIQTPLQYYYQFKILQNGKAEKNQFV